MWGIISLPTDRAGEGEGADYLSVYLSVPERWAAIDLPNGGQVQWFHEYQSSLRGGRA